MTLKNITRMHNQKYNKNKQKTLVFFPSKEISLILHEVNKEERRMEFQILMNILIFCNF